MPWSWASASRIGTSHLRNGTGCQDAHRCLEVGNALIAVASDGAGSAAMGAGGAAIVCRTVSSALADFARRGRSPDDEEIHEIVDRVRDRIALAAAKRGLTSRDFAATLVAVHAHETDTIAVHVGDGAAVVGGVDEWMSASWPDAGEFAGTTFFVTDDAGAKIRIARLGAPVDRVAVLTDGLERLALDFARNEPHAQFFEGMMRPLASAVSRGRSESVSGGLDRFLGGESVTSRTDDDKTLIIARRL
jgi:hypothetical protein